MSVCLSVRQFRSRNLYKDRPQNFLDIFTHIVGGLAKNFHFGRSITKGVIDIGECQKTSAHFPNDIVAFYGDHIITETVLWGMGGGGGKTYINSWINPSTNAISDISRNLFVARETFHQMKRVQNRILCQIF